MSTPPFHKRIKITAKRFPWQAGYNWHGMTNSTAPLNQPMPGEKAAPRFGGGWKYKAGFSYSASAYGKTLMLDLLFGIVTIAFQSAKGFEADRKWAEDRDASMKRVGDVLRASREREAAKMSTDDITF